MIKKIIFKSNFLFLFWASLIVFFAFYLRFHHLSTPSTYIFDEVYHVPTVKMIAQNDPRAYEWWHSELKEEKQTGAYIDWLHPPLAKLIQACSIKILGDQAWAWRLPSVIIGTLLVILVGKLALILWPKNYLLALGAIFLTAVDGLGIVQSRLAMNDIFVTFWLTLSLLFYYLYREKNQQKYLLPLALSIGLALATKWSGALIFIFITLWEIAKQKISHYFSHLIFFVSIASLIYLLSYTQLFLQKPFKHFIDLQAQIINYQTNLKETHPYASSPWSWPLGLKPVFLYLDNEKEIWNRPFYPLWYLGLGSLIIITLTTIISSGKKTSDAFFANQQDKNKIIFLLMAYFSFWLPWTLSPRIMFFHHYLPTTPLIWLLTSWLIFNLLCQKTKTSSHKTSSFNFKKRKNKLTD